MVDYSVKLVIGNEIGSGILFVPKNGIMAYIITAAHFFKNVDAEFQITVAFTGAGFGDKKDFECTYKCELNKKCITDEKNRVFLLQGYKKELEDSPDDGAVIEIKYQSWMKRGNISFGTASEGEHVLGYGYPRTGEMKRITFEGDIELPVGKNTNLGEEGDYIVTYNPNLYASEIPTDKSYLDGFSGTGLMVERSEHCYCIGIFSRSMEDMPRVYLTDVRKLENLILTIQSKNKGSVLPAVKVRLRGTDGTFETRDILSALNLFMEDSNKFIMCLHGYAGVGKTFAIEELKKQYEDGKVRVETSWKKLVSCLNAKSMKKLQDTIFVFDCMEKAWSKEEREEISFSKKKKGEESYRRLNVTEKAAFFERIWKCERELKANNIHILIVFRTNFLKDLKEDMCLNEHERRWEKIENTFVDCIGYSNGQILETLGEEYPKYIIEGEMTKRPLWMKNILERGLIQNGQQNQYIYEFRLIKETVDWYIKKEGPNKDVAYFAEDEEEALEIIKKEYIRFILSYEGKEAYIWQENKHLLLWCYPFKEEDDNFCIDDIVLYAFFVANELYELAKKGKKRKEKRLEFKENFLKAYHTGARDNQLGDRIIAFFRLLMIEDDNGDLEASLKGWMLEYKECMKWYDGTPTNDYYYLDRMYRCNKNENEYLNTKEEIERETYISEKNIVIEDVKFNMTNKEQNMGLGTKRRTKHE